MLADNSAAFKFKYFRGHKPHASIWPEPRLAMKAQQPRLGPSSPFPPRFAVVRTLSALVERALGCSRRPAWVLCRRKEGIARHKASPVSVANLRVLALQRIPRRARQVRQEVSSVPPWLFAFGREGC